MEQKNVIKSVDTCDRCIFGVDYCHANRESCDGCENKAVGKFLCLCRTVALNAPCPYFKKGVCLCNTVSDAETCKYYEED